MAPAKRGDKANGGRIVKFSENLAQTQRKAKQSGKPVRIGMLAKQHI